MARVEYPQVCTANHLLSGEVVYLTPDRQWSEQLADAAISQSAEDAEVLLADGTAQSQTIVGAYLFDVVLGEDGIPTPAHFRETFRARGPSNYFHGKQAEA